MRGLTILVATADPARYCAALELAAAQAALGGRARVHLHGEAVTMLFTDESAGLAELRVEAAALGVEMSACQTGLAATPGRSLPDNVAAGGPIGLLTELGEDRFVTF